jgi:hypothetical protein
MLLPPPEGGNIASGKMGRNGMVYNRDGSAYPLETARQMFPPSGILGEISPLKTKGKRNSCSHLSLWLSRKDYPMKRIILALVLISGQAMACERRGLVEIDCPTKHPSNAYVNANDRMKGAVDPDQDARLNASAAQREAASLAKREADSDYLRAVADKTRADGFNAMAKGNANRDNAAAGMMDRMYRPRPFQSGY